MKAAAVQDKLMIWTVYDHPTDWPDWFVARRFEVAAGECRPTEDVVMTRTLDELRIHFGERGFSFLCRNEGDTPGVLGCYL